MDKILVRGGTRLSGTVRANASKNAALPILAATLLADEPVELTNPPLLRDTTNMLRLLEALGVEVEHQEGGGVRCRSVNEDLVTAPYELVSAMRGSVCVLGPLLARRQRAKVSLPGGCVFGVRPIDLHLKGLRALGAEIEIEHGYVVAEAERLVGTEIYLGSAFGSTVLGTANVLMAAVLAEGRTIIENAACEPEVQDLVTILNKMGADIRGMGTHRLEVHGVERLGGTTHSVIPDRIDAATMLVAGVITGGDVCVEGMVPSHVTAVLEKIREVGCHVECGEDWVRVRPNGGLKPTDLTTLPFPGFPTDLQAQFVSLLSVVDGMSLVTEKVYPDRFIHVAELHRMGADIRKEGPTVIIRGVDKLSGAPVMASDLRASAALVLAGLVAKGETEIHRVYHLDRGYERIEERLAKLGADIERVK
ncbi:MAG: UDP-N-acetylglucosamine 1-carboxyvinyltransferase [Planctomycetota bacterium]